MRLISATAAQALQMYIMPQAGDAIECNTRNA